MYWTYARHHNNLFNGISCFNLKDRFRCLLRTANTFSIKASLTYLGVIRATSFSAHISITCILSYQLLMRPQCSALIPVGKVINVTSCCYGACFLLQQMYTKPLGSISHSTNADCSIYPPIHGSRRATHQERQ